MTHEEQAHLSKEAMDDLLIGLGSAESRAHLEQCLECGRRVKEFHTGVDAFNRASLAWSEARPYARRPAAPQLRVRRSAALPLRWALAATLFVAVGISTWKLHPFFHNHTAVSAPAQVDSEAQIAQDNDLLQSVNVALQEGEEPPVNGYNLFATPHSRLRARPELRRQ